ncbi:hypothetical protein G6011_00492 [Alternaria panax]|uniref:Ubiquitin-like domain-containing protein n=1 Tax=Alternaria panax TaxID=48097 RepID=A0AAD4II87_9PLEO|nr:hypothetical protein G6011_00492 [Alternaria panax]
MSATALTCELKGDTIVMNGDLKISFRRTVRVPETEQSNCLPPNLGAFPLKPVSQHGSSLPAGMVAKGGVFFPMYQSEAMWINFSTVHEDTLPYMIKIYIGGMNVISAAPAIESMSSRSRRQVRRQMSSSDPKAASPLQDYVVVPEQKWIDGIANGDGTVRQFVAMPLHSGHSVETQLTRQDTVAGIQIEVTPYKPAVPREFPGRPMQIFLKQLNGTTKTFNVTNFEPIGNFKLRIREVTGIPTSFIRLIYAGKQLEDGRDFEDYRISKEATIHMVLRLRGAGPVPTPEMNIAAGGLIKQVIHRDMHQPNWDTTKTTVFNVQILNSMLHQAVTGAKPLVPPIHEIYTYHGLPYYKMYEEASGTHGDFDSVKSIEQITGKAASKATIKAPRIVEIEEGHKLVNPQGPLQVLRPIIELEIALEGYHVASF